MGFKTETTMEFLELLKEIDFISGKKIYDLSKYINDAIKKLQQVEKLKAENKELKKYEQMWKELFVKEFTFELASMMISIEQKYFPKGAKSDGK